MDTIKFNKAGVKMIAHRGLSAIESQNTMSAFVAACNRSYWGVESDVHVTKDGKFVMFHDDTVKGMTGLDMPRVEECTFDELRSLTLNNVCCILGEDGSKPDRKDLVIPSLEEYIAICKKYGRKCILEIKNLVTKDDIANIINEIKKLDYLEGVVFISFQLGNLIMLRELLPNQPLQYLLAEYTDEAGAAMDKYNLDLDIYYMNLTKEIVDLMHSKNHLVNCWTCDEPEAAAQLAELGVEYITTNILE